MVDINDLVQEFWRTSSDKAVGASILPLRHLLGIFQDILIVCFVVSVFATAVDCDKIYRYHTPRTTPPNQTHQSNNI